MGFLDDPRRGDVCIEEIVWGSESNSRGRMEEAGEEAISPSARLLLAFHVLGTESECATVALILAGLATGSRDLAVVVMGIRRESGNVFALG